MDLDQGDDTTSSRLRWLAFSLRPKDALAGVAALVAGGAIMLNALILQRGPHPAPLFANKALAASEITGSLGPARTRRPEQRESGRIAAPAQPSTVPAQPSAPRPAPTQAKRSDPIADLLQPS